MIGTRSIMSLSALLAAAACGTSDNPPLVFTETNNIGITVASSPAAQGSEVTLGYRSLDLAVVPVTVTQADGTVTNLFVEVQDGQGAKASDTLSVLGQFEANAQAPAAAVGLGRFFATGLAAQKLADGFEEKLSQSAQEAQPEANPQP
jgi:hypothetical protein